MTSDTRINQAKLFEDADICIKVRIVKSDDLSISGGLIFWGKTYGNHYILKIDGNGNFVVVHWMNKRYLQPVAWRQSVALKKGLGERWEQTPIAVREYLRTLEARVAALEATVQPWLERLQQDAHNSSRPPSSDPPHALRQRPRRRPSGRKRGGPPGHQGQSRALVPIEEVESVIPVKPQQCRRCQPPLQGEDPQPSRHQVTELPPRRPVVTEYQIHQLICPAWGAPPRAAFLPLPRPEQAPVQAMYAWQSWRRAMLY